MENNKSEKYNNLVSQNYKTLNEILDNNYIPRSQIASIRKYTKFLNSISVYHPKAKKEVNMYSQEVADEIIKYANLSKIEKSKAISLLKYGVENKSQLEETRKKLSEINKANSAERTEKRNKTNMERYGTCDFINSDKAKKTIVERYGSIENYNKIMSEKKKERFKNASEKFCEENDCFMFSEIYEPSVKHLASTLNYCIEQANIKLLMFENVPYIKNSDIPLLDSELDKIGKNYSHSSKGEEQLTEFIKSICDYEIIENDRKLIFPKELDIYIPQKNLAIEYDGLYWHDEQHISDRNAHLNKTLVCNSKGVDLIHVFEDDWNSKREIVKSMICSRLGIYKEKIFARKCTIEEIDVSVAKLFFNKYHLQGFAYGDLYLGLFHGDELVQAIIINKKGFHDGNVELTRMVTKEYTQVLGGFSKLLSYACKNYGFSEIVSYVNRAWFNGKGYKSSGFEIIHENLPSYYYVVMGKKIHKSEFRKNRIKRMYEKGLLKFYDENKSEHENMLENKIYRIYDCGTIKVKYTLN